MVVLHVVIVGLGLVHHLDVVRLGSVSVQLVQLSLGHVVHDPRSVRVAHDVHGGPEAVPVFRGKGGRQGEDAGLNGGGERQNQKGNANGRIIDEDGTVRAKVMVGVKLTGASQRPPAD